jgi:pyruvate/2-oxoglutarate dehydrogenase complex dihydrolipoamide acyltransferase (E2) component
MGLGKKSENSPIDILLYQNMNVQKYLRRNYMQHIDMSNAVRLMKEYNKGKETGNKIRIPAILMKAIALSYAYTDKNGNKPYRRLSGYFSLLPWGGSWESKTIDISLMVVREIDGIKDQTCNIVFMEVDKKNTVELSEEIWKAATLPEDEIPAIKFMKKVASLPPVLTYFLLKLTIIPWIRAQIVAPTSISVLKDDVTWFDGEHTNYFGLSLIDEKTKHAYLQWIFDHRLGFGKHFGPFFAHLKSILESADFLKEDIASHKD